MALTWGLLVVIAFAVFVLGVVLGAAIVAVRGGDGPGGLPYDPSATSNVSHNWHHVSMELDAKGRLRLFIDGKEPGA